LIRVVGGLLFSKGGEMLKRIISLVVISFICLYSSIALGADRGGINSGETKTGVNYTAPELDSWTFQGTEGERILINSLNTSGNLDTKIIIYPPGGGVAEVLSSQDWYYLTWADQIDWQLQQTGLYTVVIQDGGLVNSGTYNISFLKMPGAVNSSVDLDGGAIGSGDILEGTINAASDMDAFQFYGDAGDHVIINSLNTSGNLDTKIIVYPPGGGVAEVLSSQDSYYLTWADQIDWQLQHTGLYTIVIQDGGLANSGTYDVSLTKIPSTIRPGLYNPSPANGALVYELTGSFKWDAVTGATGYDLYFEDDVVSQFTKIGDNLPSSSMSFPLLEYGKVYYWHVVAHTSGGDIQGPVWWFQVPKQATYFSDSFEHGLGNWLLSGEDWKVTTYTSQSGSRAVTDSPSGNYKANSDVALTLAGLIDLSASMSPVLTFWHKLNLPDCGGPGDRDEGYVEVSKDGGNTWSIVSDNYCTAASTWRYVQIDLSNYKTPLVKVRFRLKADSDMTVGDGWYIDDVEIREKWEDPLPYPFSDNFDRGLGNWLVNGQDWALTTSTARSGGYSVSDSPSGKYSANSEAILTLAGSVDLSESISPVLTFWHKVDVPDANDVLYIEVSNDGGNTWTSIIFSSYTFSTWRYVQINLDDYKTSTVKVRFRLRADGNATAGDGWYIDDVEIKEKSPAALPYPFSDNFDHGLGNWIASGQDWALTTSTAYSGSYSVTDSPSGNYVSNAESQIILAYPIDLSSATLPILTFWHKLNVPEATDHGYIDISIDGGSTWTYAVKDYSSTVSNWTYEQLDLSSYKASSVKVRFRLKADGNAAVGDGWYIDDVVIRENGSNNTFYTLDVAVSPSGSGTVTSKPAGIDCGSDCAESFKAGSSVTLTAAPVPGSTFQGWTGCSSATTECTVTMGSNRTVTAEFTVLPDPNQAYTTLSLDLSSMTMLQNETVDVAGQLTRLPDVGADLSGLAITFTITGPDGKVLVPSLTTATYDELGHYIVNGISGFTKKGMYTIKAVFGGSPSLGSTESDISSLLVGSAAGYAIIVEGKIEGEEGLQSHNKTANRIYNSLKERGFLDENIYYFNYDTTQAGVDEAPSKSAIQSKITTWAKGRMNGSPAPLYIIMVDHGNPGTFYINAESIAPSDINAWLDTLESGLNAAALKEKRTVIIGSCYSGSFIPSLSKAGRVVITSAAANEESYKGPNEPDGIRSGEFFLEEFFKVLERGYSLKEAFAEATEKTETFTRKGGAANSNNPFSDRSVQHPLLDDNGDHIGSNMLSDGVGDGMASEALYLGVGMTNSALNPAELVAVHSALYLNASASSALLWAEADADSEVDVAWMEARPPSKTLSGTGGTGQLELNIPKVFLTYSAANSRWQKTYTAFAEPGMYELFYFTKRKVSGEISPMKRSVVYKNKADNSLPSAFNLLSPADGSQQKTVLLLGWGSSTDSDGLTYTLLISRNPNPSAANADYIREEISTSMAAVGPEAALKDLTTYYWKVLAVDAYGATTASQVRSFKTNNTNPELPGFIEGTVTDKTSGAVVKSPTVKTSSGVIKVKGSNYMVFGRPGDVTLTVTAAGYAQSTVTTGIKAGETVKVNIPLLAIDTTPPVLDAVTPTPITTERGKAQMFTAKYSAPEGYANIKTAELLVNATLTVANSVRASYDQTTNLLTLFNDSGTVAAGTCSPGAAVAPVTNGQGALNCQQTAVSTAGETLTIKWNITPKSAFASATTAKKLFMKAEDQAANVVSWTQKGTWKIIPTNTAPTVETLTPSTPTSASGTAKTFTAVYSDADGYANLKTVDILDSSSGGVVNAIYARYDRNAKKLYLYDDAGTAYVAGSCTPGVAGALTNAQGTLDCGLTTVSQSGTNLTVRWSIMPIFTGSKQMKLRGTDNSNATTGWVSKGTWTITAAPPGLQAGGQTYSVITYGTEDNQPYAEMTEETIQTNGRDVEIHTKSTDESGTGALRIGLRKASSVVPPMGVYITIRHSADKTSSAEYIFDGNGRVSIKEKNTDGTDSYRVSSYNVTPDGAITIGDQQGQVQADGELLILTTISDSGSSLTIGARKTGQPVMLNGEYEGAGLIGKDNTTAIQSESMIMENDPADSVIATPDGEVVIIPEVGSDGISGLRILRKK
jgi:hypothetical protein